ncbi:MAG: nucleotide sugar dehydrogenase [Cytophagaceae bacterium]|nr:nucleotide sugar dehydrogenase [Cytophagaceae bacterium]
MEIVVVGLGYVGLSLAVEFGKRHKTIGVDSNIIRIDELRKGIDKNRELAENEIFESKFLKLYNEIPDNTNQKKRFYIITVSTTVDKEKKPDLTYLLKATQDVGTKILKGDIIIYESTVYPGCTEEDCVPVLEKFSGFTYNADFFCGYSPERINPGDKKNRLPNILKITSGSTPEIAIEIDKLYKSIIKAGTYTAPSIKVAEAAKLIENCQRDVNISFMNELALIFDKMNLDTQEVLEAAGTKWNFLKFQPGLVGGHCIGVDPYYMLHKAEQLGYSPALIGSGRRINDNMGSFVANKVIKLMIQKNIEIKEARALVLGITFKENCPDIRNTKVVDIYAELKEFGLDVEIYDSWADKEEVNEEYGIKLISEIKGQYDVVLHTVSHQIFSEIQYEEILKPVHVLFDVKGTLSKEIVDGRL